MGKQRAEEQKEGAPLWMVSFGDMMTLILTFFILLVSMSEEQQQGLLAKGVGSFLVALRSYGLPGMMGEDDKMRVFDDVRARFNLPPENDPERREDFVTASDKELVRADIVESLAPHQQLQQPAVAVFPVGSDELTEDGKDYLDRLAPTLHPAFGQVLILEGHASDAGARHAFDNQLLAFERARVVRDYFVERHGFSPKRLEARAWLREITPDGLGTRTVDARLVTPEKKDNDSDGSAASTSK